MKEYYVLLLLAYSEEEGGVLLTASEVPVSGREEMLRVFSAVQKQIVKGGIEQKAHEHAKNMEKIRRAYIVEVEGGWIKNNKEKRLVHGSALFSKLDDAVDFYTDLQVKIAELLDQERRSKTSVKETS